METWDDIIEQNDKIHKVYLQLADNGEVTPEVLLEQCPVISSIGQAKDWIESEKVWKQQMERE